MSSYGELIADAGALAALLQLEALDARIRHAAGADRDVVRQVNEKRVQLESLTRSIERERAQLARLAPHDRERVRLELLIRNRQHQVARLADALDRDHRGGEPTRERARDTIRASVEERESLLLHLDCALVARYEELAHRQAPPTIVFAGQGRCGGCALPLPPGLMGILQRPNVIATCPRCERMIYGRLLDA